MQQRPAGYTVTPHGAEQQMRSATTHVSTGDLSARANVAQSESLAAREGFGRSMRRRAIYTCDTITHREEGEGGQFGGRLLLWLQGHGKEPVVILVQDYSLRVACAHHGISWQG
jgi:hypothetical protein